MPNPRKIPKEFEPNMERWLREGKTYAWIKEQFRNRYKKDISDGTIVNFRKEKNIPDRYAVAARKQGHPWKVLPEHRGVGIDPYLSALIRRDAGLPVPQERLTSAENWWAEMQELGLVASYSPQRGWVTLPRRRGIDLGYIREPDSPN